MIVKPNTLKRLRNWISIPIIYAMIVPSVFLDIPMEVYHRTCFMLYRIPYVKRKDYIKVDRYKLKYLSFFQKIACSFCGYVNGLFAYAVRIAGDTEKYWCGIKHAEQKDFHKPKHHENFLEYDDEESFIKKFK